MLGGFGHRVEDRHFVFKELPAFARRDTRDDLGAVSEAQLRVPRAETAGDALDENSGLRSDENGHEEIYDFGFTICDGISAATSDSACVFLAIGSTVFMVHLTFRRPSRPSAPRRPSSRR